MSMAQILIIDDDKLFGTMLCDQLAAAGYQVVVAFNGVQGLKLYQQRQPDLVITDIIMPEMDGIETIMELRRHNPHLKIIAVSGGVRDGAGSYLRPAALLGAQRTFTKPVDIRELLEAVSDLLAQHDD
jgi:CheY-like chemotaxis protein